MQQFAKWACPFIGWHTSDCSIREYRSDFVKTYWIEIEAYRTHARLVRHNRL